MQNKSTCYSLIITLSFYNTSKLQQKHLKHAYNKQYLTLCTSSWHFRFQKELIKNFPVDVYIFTRIAHRQKSVAMHEPTNAHPNMHHTMAFEYLHLLWFMITQTIIQYIHICNLTKLAHFHSSWQNFGCRICSVNLKCFAYFDMDCCCCCCSLPISCYSSFYTFVVVSPIPKFSHQFDDCLSHR